MNVDGDPIEDRKGPTGRNSFVLSEKERLELKRRQMCYKIADLFITQGKGLDEAAQEMGITSAEAYALLFGQQSEEPHRRAALRRLVEKVLDLDNPKSRKEFLKELGITQNQWQYLIRSDEFREIYAERFNQLRSDPNIKAIQAHVVENLLPQALKVLEQELRDPNVPWSIRDKAIDRVFKMVGIAEVKPIEDDRAEAIKFLQKHNIETVTISLQLPDQYKEALDKLQTVEGEYSEVNPE